MLGRGRLCIVEEEMVPFESIVPILASELLRRADLYGCVI